uniref:Ig-like domain-containing protein n=1 Tax=Neogobius melanostomus TaxID=47308 RepID=A0A8C6TUY8_9GOBI
MKKLLNQALKVLKYSVILYLLFIMCKSLNRITMFVFLGGPDNVSISVDSGDVLPNGTYTFIKGSPVFIICSGVSYPSPDLSLSFNGLVYSNKSLANNTGKSLMEYRIDSIQPNAQGIYSCIAHNTLSHHRVNKSAELLVYYASDRHPECMWTQDSTFVVFHCLWSGTYPAPNLTWTDGSTSLASRQTLQCKARHQALHKGDDKSCTFTLKTPYPVGERGLKQDLIINGSKYIITEAGPLFKMTIVNVTKEDEGVYFCRSENPVGARVLEIYLTVKCKTSSAYTGAVIGLFIAVLIVGCTIIIARTLYSGRHKICLGKIIFREDGDVLSLVDSDDEQIFQATVPRLPPVSNGCQTTLVEIHRIPSTDHEEAETVDRPQQQDNSDKTEDLVTF